MPRWFTVLASLAVGLPAVPAGIGLVAALAVPFTTLPNITLHSTTPKIATLHLAGNKTSLLDLTMASGSLLDSVRILWACLSNDCNESCKSHGYAAGCCFGFMCMCDNEAQPPPGGGGAEHGTKKPAPAKHFELAETGQRGIGFAIKTWQTALMAVTTVAVLAGTVILLLWHQHKSPHTTSAPEGLE